MTVTSPSDVGARLGRALTTDEQTLAQTLIGDAERMIAGQVPGHDLADIDEDALKQVVGSAVARVLRNPDGYRNEAVGGVSYTLDSRVAAGFLMILSEEWALLGLSSPSSNGGAFSFAPYMETWPVRAPLGWSPWC